MATTETTYGVASLPQQAREGDGDRVFIRLRRDLDIGAFGASASYQAKAGEDVVGEHDELGPGADGQEELYVVVQGSALVLYNIACMNSLLGRTDEALEILRKSVTAWPGYKENARADDDFASLREDARFTELVG